VRECVKGRQGSGGVGRGKYYIIFIILLFLILCYASSPLVSWPWRLSFFLGFPLLFPLISPILPYVGRIGKKNVGNRHDKTNPISAHPLITSLPFLALKGCREEEITKGKESINGGVSSWPLHRPTFASDGGL